MRSEEDAEGLECVAWSRDVRRAADGRTAPIRFGNPLQRPPFAECMQNGHPTDSHTYGTRTMAVVAHVANFFRETKARNASAGRKLLHAALGHGERSRSQFEKSTQQLLFQ